MNKLKVKHWLTLGGLILLVIAWSAVLSIWSPDQIIEAIGVRSSYAAMFFIAVFGGVSTFTGVSYFAALITLGSGGLNPFILGVLAGTGLFISDSFFFYLGMQGRKVVGGQAEGYVEKFGKWLRSKPRWVAPVATFLYTGLTPLPNDVLTIALALAEIPYKRIALSLWIGSITLTTIVAYLAAQGFNFT